MRICDGPGSDALDGEPRAEVHAQERRTHLTGLISAHQVAGGARGGLVTERFLDRSKEPHAKALVSICRLMGLDVNSVGNRDMNSGPLAGIG